MTENKTNKQTNNQDFEVVVNSKLDDDTVLITSQELTQQWLSQAMNKFANNYKQYSTYLKEGALGSTQITNDELDTLAQNPQSNLEKVIRINNIARYYINKDDLIGKVYETIESNVNTEYKLSYRDFSSNRNKQKQIEKVKDLIDSFNEQINLEALISKIVPMTYAEGNYPMYLKKSNNRGYVVDYYPLGVIEVSDYELNGEPYLVFNVKELKSRLQKIYKKNKNGKSLFFDNMDDEVKSNYPEEVFIAYKNNENYCKLNIENSSILRINNMNRKYGVTPIFRTFRPASMLETFESTDKINAKSKGKKIIWQKLRKELLGGDGNNKAFEEMSYAHDAFMAAWKNDIVIYTSPAWVEEILYVEPKIENTNIDSINYYRDKITTQLGISFLNPNSKGSFSSAQISIKELMKTINKITEQLEKVLKKWYKIVLRDNGFDELLCPQIKIIDSELLETELKLKLVEILYSKLNCSFETAYNILGVDYEDEKIKRIKENDENADDIFRPRQTNYTFTDTNDNGRPQDENSKDPNKQQDDIDRRKAKEDI